MDTVSLEKHFRRIGARLRVRDLPAPSVREPDPRVSLDVVPDRFGECFELRRPQSTAAEAFAVNVAPRERHLLMAIRERDVTSKLLCGHDERHWFVAGLPDFANGAGTVQRAKDALKPAGVRAEELRTGLRASDRNRRRNEAFLRQGEWFFLPRPGVTADPRFVLRDEPLSRGAGSKPHRLEECVRLGGLVVYVTAQRPSGVSEAEYRRLLSRSAEARRWTWRVQRRNPTLFARGRVRHADHATIVLNGWHEVVMNTEGQSKASRFVAFLD